MGKRGTRGPLREVGEKYFQLRKRQIRVSRCLGFFPPICYPNVSFLTWQRDGSETVTCKCEVCASFSRAVMLKRRFPCSSGGQSSWLYHCKAGISSAFYHCLFEIKSRSFACGSCSKQVELKRRYPDFNQPVLMMHYHRQQSRLCLLYSDVVTADRSPPP